MLFGAWGGLAALAALVTAVPGIAETPYEARVLAALNFARAQPVAYAETLKRYRTYYRAKLVSPPGAEEDVETVEGVRPVDEAIAFLTRRPAIATVAPGNTLAAAATDHAAQQAHSGAIGHGGDDGSSPSDRAERRGGGPYVAEAIMYGAADADDVVRQLIIDDGVADRGHRTILFEAHLHFAGVACRPHPSYRTVCVIDLADTPDGREQGYRVAAR